MTKTKNGYRFLLASLSALLASACATAPGHANSSGAGTDDGEPLAIIDAHTHTRFRQTLERTSKISDTEEQYLKELKSVGGVGAVSHTSADGNGFQESLRSKTKMVFCAGVDAKPNVKFIEDGLKAGRFSCMKVYLGYVHQWAWDKNYEPVYKLAEKYDVPVVFHTGDTYATDGKLKYADPLTIDEVAVDHPKVTFVIAHMGNPWVQSAAEVAYKNPNVYLEASALLIGNLDKEPVEKVNRYVVEPIAWAWGYVENSEKIMFGTDWPLTDIASYVRAVKRAVPKEHWKAMFHDNAARVFKFDRK